MRRVRTELRERLPCAGRYRSSSCWAAGHRTSRRPRPAIPHCPARRHRRNLRASLPFAIPAWTILPGSVQCGLHDWRHRDGGGHRDANAAAHDLLRDAVRHCGRAHWIRSGHRPLRAQPRIPSALGPAAEPDAARPRAAAQDGVLRRGVVHGARPGAHRWPDDHDHCARRPAASDDRRVHGCCRRGHRGADHRGRHGALRRDVRDVVHCDAGCAGADCRCRAHWSRWRPARPACRTGNA